MRSVSSSASSSSLSSASSVVSEDGGMMDDPTGRAPLDRVCRMMGELFVSRGGGEEEEWRMWSLEKQKQHREAGEIRFGVIKEERRAIVVPASASAGVSGVDQDLVEQELIDVAEARIGDRAAARILVRISRTVTEMAKLGDKILAGGFVQDASTLSIPAKGSLTIEFNGAKKPKIPLEQYLCHLVRYINAHLKHKPSTNSAGIRALLSVPIYIDRLRKHNTSFLLNSLNVHRVFLTAVLVSIKFAEDKHPTNAYVANLGGIDLKQMNYLESSFCSGLEFSLGISLSEISEAYDLFDPGYSHSIVAPAPLSDSN